MGGEESNNDSGISQRLNIKGDLGTLEDSSPIRKYY
jgi:hypothetical protein